MALQPDTGQRCPTCAMYEVHSFHVPSDNPEEPQVFPVCLNCDWGIGPYDEAFETFMSSTD